MKRLYHFLGLAFAMLVSVNTYSQTTQFNESVNGDANNSNAGTISSAGTYTFTGFISSGDTDNLTFATSAGLEVSQVTFIASPGGGQPFIVCGYQYVAPGGSLSGTPPQWFGTSAVTIYSGNSGSGTHQLSTTYTGGAGNWTYTVTVSVPPSPPTVTTATQSNVSQTSATLGGNVTADGGASVTDRGIVWNTSGTPTTADTKVANGSGTGTFSGTVNSLPLNTLVYVRAYATNAAGTSYGNQISFTTLAVAVPTLTTATPSSITTTSAVLGGAVTYDGGATASPRGIVWSTSTNPTTADNTVPSGGFYNFSDNVTGLPSGTLIYVRAYATNTAGTGYGPQQSFTTLSPTVYFSVNDPSVSEGNSGSTTLTFTVSLSGAAPAGGATVDYATSNGTASAGTDYTAVGTTTLSFSAGETSKTVDITLSGDNTVEADETLTLTLSNPTGTDVQISDATGTGTITNDDQATVTIADVSVNEDDGSVTVTLSLNAAVDGGFDVDVSTSDNTATTADADYTAVTSATETFGGTAGETETFTISIGVDTKVEADETLNVAMSNLVPVTVDGSDIDISDGATVTLTNDDQAQVTIADVSGNEDDGAITVTLTLDAAVDGGFDVDVSTADGTATTANSDYTAVTNQTLTFAGTASETETFTITPTSDSNSETDETVLISMSNVVPTTVSGSDIDISDGATMTILDDDDGTPPSAVCQDVTVQLDATGNATISTSDVDGGSTDNVGIASMGLSQSSFDCSVYDNINTMLDQSVGELNTQIPESQFMYQSFTATNNGWLSSVEFSINTTSGNPRYVTARIYDASGVPGNLIAIAPTVIIPGGSNGYFAFDFSGIRLTAGQSYRVEVRFSGGLYMWMLRTTTNPYAGGVAGLFSGGFYNEFPDTDLAFRVNYVPFPTTTLTVLDASNNSSSCTSEVNVVDNTAPSVVTQNITISLDASGNASISTSDVDDGTTDNCSIYTASLSKTDFSCSDLGVNTVTLTATDFSRNSGSNTATVTVVDNIAPTATCRDVTVQLDASGSATLTTGQVNSGSSDNCGITSMTLSETSFDCNDISGTNVVTLTVYDASGNSSSCTSTITVRDYLAPTATCQDVTIQLDANGNISLSTSDVNDGSMDNCGIASMSLSKTSFGCDDLGSTNLVPATAISQETATTLWGVGYEESAWQSFTVTEFVVLDTIQIYHGYPFDLLGSSEHVPMRVNLYSGEGTSGTLIASSDNTNSHSNPSSSTNEYSWKDYLFSNVSLDAGQVYTWEITPSNGFNNFTLDWIHRNSGNPYANGRANTGVSDDFAFRILSSRNTNEVTLTVTDLYGNSSTCTSVVTVEDNTAPSAICQNVTVQLDASGNGTISTSDVNNGSSDNCDLANMTLSKSAFTCSDVGSNTVTLTVNDVNGNSSNCTASVTVVDNIAPTAICQAVTVQLDASGNGSISTSDVDNGSSDNCAIASISLNDEDFTCSDVGANTVTLTVTDASGNSSTCSAAVMVQDNIAPTALCQNVTVQLDASGNGSISTSDVDNGSTDNCLFTMSLDDEDFTCSDVGANTVTLTVTDVNGNVSTCTASVTVEDNVAPTAICQDVTVQLDASGNGSITTNDINNGSSDACGIASVVLDDEDFTCSDVGANTVTLTVTDVNGNASTCTATVTVEDNIAPTIACMDFTDRLPYGGTYSLDPMDIDNGSSDACGIASYVISQTTFTATHLGANTVYLTVTDNNGNSSTCSSTFTLTADPPEALCQDVTVQLNSTGSYTLLPSTVDAGSNSPYGVPVITTVFPFSFDCGDVGVNTVTLTVSDQYGGVSTCTATVTVVDVTPPTAICQSISIHLDATGNGSITADQINNGSTDACGIATITVSPSSFDCSDLGANTVTLTVTDVNGNSSTCDATVTVSDVTPPVMLCQNTTIQLDANGQASISTADIDNGSSDACSGITLSLSKTMFGCSDLGANNVTLTGVDAVGNTSSCVAVVTVVDNIAPQTQCQDITLPLNGQGTATLTASMIDGGSTDNCSIASMSVSPSSFDCANIGLNTVTLSVTDGSGNVSTCTSSVTVVDQTAPQVSCQAYTYTLVNGTVTINPNDFASATDNCAVVSISANLNTFNCSQVGSYTVVITATDGSGNTGTCSTTITIVDNSMPTAVCQNATVVLDASGSGSIAASDIDNGSSAGCGGALTYSLSRTSFDCSDIGVQNVTLTVTDVNGATASCTAQVTVVDNTPPTALCQNATVVLDANGQASITTADIDNGSSDECGSVTLSLSKTSFDCSDVGSNAVTLTATDESGNTSSCTAQVTVVDQTPPVVTCSNPTVALNASGSVSIVPGQLATATDACGILSLTASQTIFDCGDVGTVSVTITATDANGNISTCTSTVTVTNNGTPTLTCKNATVQLDANGNASITSADVVATATAKCGITSVSLSDTQFDCNDLGANSVVVVVTGANGQTATCTAQVTVEDNIAPSVVCQNANIYLDANGQPVLTIADLGLIFSDNCGVTGANYDISQFDCDNLGVQSLDIDVFDASGNTTTCTSNVTVLDTIKPDVTCQDVSVSLDASGIATIAVSDAFVSGSDNCPGTTYALDKTSFNCSDLGTQFVTLTATDAAGNTEQCTFVVTVSDNVAPSVQCQDITRSIGTSGSVSIQVSDVVASSSDNCAGWSLSLSESNFDCNDVGANTVTITATDVSGNTAMCTATVTIVDQTGPSMACPNDITVNNDPNVCGAAVSFVTPVATDGCGAATVTQTAGLPSGNTFPIGTTTVSFQAADASGNTTTCSFNVTVVDNEAPSVSCLSTVTGGVNSNQTTAVITFSGPTAVDNCGSVPAVLVSGIPSGGTFPLGITTNVYSFTDAAGNTSTCTFDVVVSDPNAPQLNCPSNINVSNDVGICGAVVNFNAPSVVGGGGPNYTTQRIDNNQTLVSGSVFPIGSTSIQWSVTKLGSSAVSYCSITITVSDSEGPVISCPANISVPNNTGQCGAVVNYATPTATDNCSVSSLTRTNGPASGSTFPVGTTPVTYQAVDASGNTTQCTFFVTVADNEPPIISCPADITVNTTGSACSAIVNYPFPTATDNCPGQITMTQSGNNSGGTFGVGTHTIMFTATDQQGNSSSCSFNITVNSSISVDLGADITACSSATLLPQAPSGATYLWSTGANSPSITVTSNGTYSVTMTWPGGCSASDDIDVTITGNPTVTLSGFPTPSFYCLEGPPLPLTGAPSGGTFSGPGMSGSNFDPSLSGSGTFTIWYNYTNANGCSGSASQQVTVLPCDGIGLEEEVGFVPKLYPNPTADRFTLEWEQSVPEDIEIRVVNTLGQIVFEGTQDPLKDKMEINTQNWAQGNYTVLIQHSEGVERLRLVISR